MELNRCRQVVIFGGSFDPPHLAHIALPAMAMQAIDAQAVVYIPAGIAPHKRDREQTPAHHRLAMTRLLVQPYPWATVLDDEIKRASQGPTYTVDTLESLREQLGPSVQMRLLIGSDQLRMFDRWREPARIIELAQPLVMVRPPDDRGQLLASLPAGFSADEWEPRLLDLPQLDISSTRLRQYVASGKTISGFVPPAVEAYIREHGLYQ